MIVKIKSFAKKYKQDKSLKARSDTLKIKMGQKELDNF